MQQFIYIIENSTVKQKRSDEKKIKVMKMLDSYLNIPLGDLNR